MTPHKIKAKELVEKYASIIPNSGYYTDAEYIVNNDSIEIAKQCAIIAVNGILESKKLDYLFTQEEIKSMEYTSDEAWIKERFDLYWQEVIEEINKL